MQGEVNTIMKIGFWSVVLCVIVAIMVLVNGKSFQNQVAAPKTVSEQLDFPLSKMTVSIKKSPFMQVLKNCDWIKASNNIGSSISIMPASGSEEIFAKIVNESLKAETLAKLYAKEGFKWDSEKLELTIPVYDSAVLAPTWLVFELVEEGLFVIE